MNKFIQRPTSVFDSEDSDIQVLGMGLPKERRIPRPTISERQARRVGNRLPRSFGSFGRWYPSSMRKTALRSTRGFCHFPPVGRLWFYQFDGSDIKHYMQ